MSLRTVIQQAIQSGINSLDDLAERATYTRVSGSTYNTTTGLSTPTQTAYTSVPIIFTSYSRQEIDGEAIRPEDQKAIIATRHLTPIPTLNDTITRTDGTVWAVISIMTDPAQAAWVLQVRRP